MARKKALEGIVYLAFQDEQALAHLRSLRAAETIKDQMSYFLDYCDKSIVTSAELALACVKETDVFRLVKEFGDDSQSVDALLDFMRYTQSIVAKDILTIFLRHRVDQSYLAVRLLAFRVVTSSPLLLVNGVERFLADIISFVITSDQDLFWDEVDKIYKSWFHEMYRTSFLFNQNIDLLRIMLQ